jgi:hypothetical protein
MKNTFTFILFLVLYATTLQGQYTESFNLANKGILAGPCGTSDPTSCLTVDFSGVNWTLGGDLSGIDAEGFKTENGHLLSEDLDEVACWISPTLDISNSSTVSFSVTIVIPDGAVWENSSTTGSVDFVDVKYSVDGGAFVTLANITGCPGSGHTISSSGCGFDLTGPLTYNPTISGLNGSTLDIQVCFDSNSAEDDGWLEEVNVPEAGVTIFSAAVCPTIGSVTTMPTTVTENAPFNISSLGLMNMAMTDNSDQDYGIRFVAFTGTPADPYVGGTDLQTIPFNNLGNGGTTASASGAMLATAGTYTVYAVLSPTPANGTCRPFVASAPLVVEAASCMPVINGINVVVCPGTPTGNFTIEADGELNGADAWYIELVQVGEACGNFTGQQGLSFTESITLAFTMPDAEYVIYAIGACVTEQVCFSFTPNGIFGIPSFTLATTTYNELDGIQTNLGGATPVGGIYSGPGVTDDGNGMTFSFDPAAAGVGNHSVTYTTGNDAGACSNLSASVTITVEGCVQPVITSIEVIGCPTSADLMTLRVNGSLGDASQWEWTGADNGEGCNNLNAVLFEQEINAAFPSASDRAATYYVRATAGCATEPVCLAYVPNDLFATVLPTAELTIATSTYCASAGLQTGLSGGTPTGGVYSGVGVTDDGNGMTYTFDPATAGVGVQTITYTAAAGSFCGDGIASATVEVFALPTVTFASSLSTVSVDAGLQTSISGGSPAGGVYSGPGVTDEGNGLSFSFDPAVAGTGEVIVTYTFTDGNGCSDNQSDVITVEDVQLVGDICPDAIDINVLFDGPLNEALVSTTQDNTGYNADNDPSTGYDCWFGDEPVLNNTIWYAFTGDGEKYGIRSIQCDTINPMINTDTQFALYSGDCTTPIAVACNDDEDFDNAVYNSYMEIVTEPGVEYLLMVDGYVAVADYEAIGSFCLEVTLLESVGVTDLANTDLRLYPNPTHGEVQLPALTMERVEVYDVAGKLVLSNTQVESTVDLTAQPAGLYLLKIFAAGEVYSAKVVRQ